MGQPVTEDRHASVEETTSGRPKAAAPQLPAAPEQPAPTVALTPTPTPTPAPSPTPEPALGSLRDDALHTVAEVAERLRVSRMTVYRLIERGDLSSVRIGRAYRVPASALASMLTSPVLSEPTATGDPGPAPTDETSSGPTLQYGPGPVDRG